VNSGDPNQRDWYNTIATRNGGYRKTWSSTIEGESGEEAFRNELFNLLEPHMEVLDAGCGSGEFSVDVARRVRHLTGLDFAENMINLASENAKKAGIVNCDFVVVSTHEMPFAANSFDLIYSRRGPTSVLLYPHLLRAGGWMLDVQSAWAEVIEGRRTDLLRAEFSSSSR
jgi:SAM-dependent methyltransferase